MNYSDRQPIPLRADPGVIIDNAMTSLARAAHLTVRRVREPQAKSLWRGDREADVILRGAVSPAATTDADYTALMTVKMALLAALTPVSAAAAVIAKAMQLSFDGALQISIPELTLPFATWCRENQPIPVAKGSSTSGPMIEPYKLAVITSLTNEMMARSNAVAIIKQLLVENAAPVLDSAMFSADAGTPGLQPPGLLNGIAPIAASSAGGSYDNMVSDVGNLVQSLASVSGAGQPIIIAAPKQATMLGFAARDPLTVLSSAALPVGTVVAVVPQALATVIEAPRLDAAKEATLHMNDAPQEIVGSGGTVASGPVINVFDSDCTALRMIMPATWQLRSPSAVAWVQGTTW